MARRFGLGQPVDTYGEPCPHVKAATQVKETVEALSNKDIIEAQALIFWKQAISEAVQDGNLKALADVADDLGTLRSYYENVDLSLVLKGTTSEGKNMRVTIPPNLTDAMMVREGPVQAEIINLATGETYSFYNTKWKIRTWTYQRR